MVLGTMSPPFVGARRFIRSEVGAAHFRDLPSVNQLYGDADFIIEQQLVPFRFIVIFKSFETPNVGFSFAVSYEDNISYTVCKSIHESLFLTGISDINPLF